MRHVGPLKAENVRVRNIYEAGLVDFLLCVLEQCVSDILTFFIWIFFCESLSEIK